MNTEYWFTVHQPKEEENGSDKTCFLESVWCKRRRARNRRSSRPAIPGDYRKANPTSPSTENGVLIDTAQCVGCRSCQRACKVANNLPSDDYVTCLSATTLTYVDLKNVSQTVEKPVVKPVKLQCMHCEDPACVSVCPVGALTKR